MEKETLRTDTFCNDDGDNDEDDERESHPEESPVRVAYLGAGQLSTLRLLSISDDDLGSPEPIIPGVRNRCRYTVLRHLSSRGGERTQIGVQSLAVEA